MHIEIDDLSAIVGPTHLLTKQDLSGRQSGYCKTSQQANGLVRPESTEELAAIAAYALKHGITLIPQGGLTGLVNGTAAEDSNIIVSFERMNKVVRVDPVQNILVAEAGARLQDLHDAAGQHGLMLGVDIPSRGTCTVGGVVSTNAGGIRVLRYGMTRENILGVTAVLADGTIIDASNTLMKNNAGFDLKQLFIGSEGTLGMVTTAVFKLFPKPVSENTALVALNSIDHTLALLSLARRQLGAQLLSFEVMWKDYYAKVTEDPMYGEPPLPADYSIYAIIESAELPDPTAGSALQSMLEEAMESTIIADAAIAQSEKERQKIWQAREDSEYTCEGYDELYSYDVGFELKDIGPFVSQLTDAMNKDWPDKVPYIFGHLGDGNLHIVLALTSAEYQNARQFDDVIYEVVGRFHNSTVSAEHGIGTLKRPYLAHSRSEEQIALMRVLKTALDPTGILNPGKVV